MRNITNTIFKYTVQFSSSTWLVLPHHSPFLKQKTYRALLDSQHYMTVYDNLWQQLQLAYYYYKNETWGEGCDIMTVGQILFLKLLLKLYPILFITSFIISEIMYNRKEHDSQVKNWKDQEGSDCRLIYDVKPVPRD